MSLRALVGYYRSVVALAVLGGLLAWGVAALLPERYAATATMFAATSLGDSSRALQADEFSQRRVQSYVGVLESDAMAEAILADTGFEMEPEALSQRVDVSAPADTVLMHVAVLDESPANALRIARSLTEIATEEVQRVDPAAEMDLVALAAPRVSDEPVSPRTALIAMIGLILGAGLGVAQAVSRLQATRNAEHDVRPGGWRALPVISSIPFQPRATHAPVQPSLDRASAWSESFRHLRAAIRPAAVGEGARVVLVVGAVADSGATTTAVNYANAAAAWGHRVLLVDGDLRGRGVGQYLELDTRRGLTQALERPSLRGSSAVLGLVQRWGSYDLDVMMRGPLEERAADLLGAGPVATLLGTLRSHYELIVIDCAPAIAFADAASLAPLVDDVMLVVSDRVTSDEEIDLAIELLKGVGASLTGVVLTMQGDTAGRLFTRK